jgi:hypothetical protein
MVYILSTLSSSLGFYDVTFYMIFSSSSSFSLISVCVFDARQQREETTRQGVVIRGGGVEAKEVGEEEVVSVLKEDRGPCHVTLPVDMRSPASCSSCCWISPLAAWWSARRI